MKVILKDVGGPSPGLMIIGEREHLLELASTLQSKVTNAPPEKNEEIPLVDSVACDGSKEWISIKVVRDIQPEITKTQASGRKLAFGLWFIIALIVTILALACYGLIALIR